MQGSGSKDQQGNFSRQGAQTAAQHPQSTGQLGPQGKQEPVDDEP